MPFVCHQGRFVDAHQAIVEGDSRGLRYGDGLFETLRYDQGRLRLAEAHFQRLFEGLHQLRFEIPKSFSPASLTQQIHTLVQKNKLSRARIRLTVFRGRGGLYDPEDLRPRYLIEALPLSETQGEWNVNGLVCCLYSGARKAADAFSRYKHNGFLPYLMGALEARQRQCNDAFLLNTEGRICDSTLANIFLIRQGRILTPPLTEGCIAGVMRAAVLQQLQVCGIPAEERPLHPDDLTQAEELFLTNAIRRIQWVGQVEDLRFSHRQTREIHQLLRQTNPDVFC